MHCLYVIPLPLFFPTLSYIYIQYMPNSNVQCGFHFQALTDVASLSTTNSFPAFLVSLVYETSHVHWLLWSKALSHQFASQQEGTGHPKPSHTLRVEHLLDCAGTGTRLLGDKDTLKSCTHISLPSLEWFWEVWVISYPAWHVYSSECVCPSRYELLCTSMPRMYSVICL